MEQSPVLGRLFHARVTSKIYLSNYFWLIFFVVFLGLLSVLIFVDYLFISSAYTHTLIKGASVQIVFGFEVSQSTLLFDISTNYHCLNFQFKF